MNTNISTQTNNITNTNISTRLNELRKGTGLTQLQFAQQIGATQSALSSFERGDRLPTLDMLMSIATTMKVSLDWLCGLSDIKAPNSGIKTYSDLIKTIMLLEKTPEVPLEIIKEEISYIGGFGLGPRAKLKLCIADDELAKFYDEWQEISSIRDKTPSGNMLYDIWLKDVYERYDFPLPSSEDDD